MNFKVRQRPANLTWQILEVTPGEHGHNGVMIDVQERDLVLLLTQHEEDRVEQFDQFQHQVPPGALPNLAR